ncbi:MocR-like pyridoxine biosynthesis transcription factor PdxR [Dictyobacter arantiisoli]|uniref:Transcriptional regulator n=1 Tax=Dictyobacter arantiisoli TaxID=2014874 RepID=A0A5A5T6I4_9CHLR|nr:PLP-dependent aminotransferase family protein [Dictyobacter arantiisoli]GCF06639.1 transcriptional regulator [Dictyobacter arantiisoli]
MGQAKSDQLQQQSIFTYDTTTIHALIHLERANGTPLYRQISQGLREAILAGTLAEGTRLPTERALARELCVNRTTIMNAYNDLAGEGLIEGHVGRGTLVKRAYFRQDDEYDYCEQTTPSWLLGLSANGDSLLGQDERTLSGTMFTEGPQPQMISLSQSIPSASMLPTERIQQIIAESLDGARESALGYCPVEGLQMLRRHIALRMRQRGVLVDVPNILILSGSTQGLGLIGRFLLSPGDEVVVEVPTYLGAIQTFRALGAHIIGVPTDNEGMRVDMLEAILARRQPRFIYTLPTFQNPTGSVLSAERRRRLLQLAKRYQIPIIEDDAYGELYFTEQAPQPLKAQDRYGNVLYLGTYSKILAPGLRVAWLAAPEPVIERLALYKQTFDMNTNALGQWIIQEMLSTGWLDEHLARARKDYQHKLTLMLEAIERYWPRETRLYIPEGGMQLWCRLPGDMRARQLFREALREQVSFYIGELFHVDGGGQHYIRLSFASVEEQQIVEGVRRIGVAMKHLRAWNLRSAEHSYPIDRLPVV